MIKKPGKQKRNKNWVKRYRFLIIPKPLEDELLSSWLIRVAFAHGRSLAWFLTLYVKHQGNEICNDDIDFRYNRRFFKTISLKSKLDYQTIYKMSIRSEEGYLYACNNCLYPPKQIRKQKDRRTHNGLLFCPQCLKEDKIPYYRKQWRYTFYNACPKHKLFLADRCGVCYERVKLPKMKPNGSIAHCSKCGNDLGKTRTRKVPDSYSYGLAATKWFEEGLRNGYFIINSNKVHSLWIFQSYTRLSQLLDRKEDLVLNNFPMIEEYKTLCKKLNHYNSKKCGPIYKNFFLNSMVFHLFQNCPDNLISFAKDNHITHRDFIHGFNDIPFWYKENIDKYIPMQNTVGREITKCEVVAAIKYLEGLNIKVTQEEVARVLGCHFTINKEFVKIYKDLNIGND